MHVVENVPPGMKNEIGRRIAIWGGRYETQVILPSAISRENCGDVRNLLAIFAPHDVIDSSFRCAGRELKGMR
jgi:hypothetical protein